MSDLIGKLYSPGELRRTVGRQAAKRRKAFGLRQSDLAERSGVSLATVARFERSGDAGFAQVVLLAIALDAEADVLALFSRETEHRSLDRILADEALPQRVRVPSGRRGR